VKRAWAAALGGLAAVLVVLEIAARLLPPPAAPPVSEAVPFEHNSKGLRDVERAYQKGDVFRIVATGDSFTYGFGVKFEDIFLRRLERSLNGRGGRRVEVINGARGAANTRQEYEWLKDEGVKYSPDLILVVFFFNDATGLPTNPLITRYRSSPRPGEELLFRSRLYRFVRDRWLKAAVTRATLREYKEAFFDNAPRWRECRESMLAIRRLSEERGARLVFAVFPVLYDLDDDHFLREEHDAVVAFLRENGIETHTLLPAFLDYDGPEESLWVHPADSHPNAISHAIAAESLSAYLGKLLEMELK
jgi:lysophospholipase L1-like esterase